MLYVLCVRASECVRMRDCGCLSEEGDGEREREQTEEGDRVWESLCR